MNISRKIATMLEMLVFLVTIFKSIKLQSTPLKFGLIVILSIKIQNVDVYP